MILERQLSKTGFNNDAGSVHSAISKIYSNSGKQITPVNQWIGRYLKDRDYKRFKANRIFYTEDVGSNFYFFNYEFIPIDYAISLIKAVEDNGLRKSQYERSRPTGQTGGSLYEYFGKPHIPPKEWSYSKQWNNGYPVRRYTGNADTVKQNRNTVPLRAHAESVLAYCQLLTVSYAIKQTNVGERSGQSVFAVSFGSSVISSEFYVSHISRNGKDHNILLRSPYVFETREQAQHLIDNFTPLLRKVEMMDQENEDNMQKTNKPLQY